MSAENLLKNPCAELSSRVLLGPRGHHSLPLEVLPPLLHPCPGSASLGSQWCCAMSQRGQSEDIERGKRWHPATWEGRARSLPAQAGGCSLFLWAGCVSGPWATWVQRSGCCDLLAALQGAPDVTERGRESRMASRFPRQPETLPGAGRLRRRVKSRGGSAGMGRGKRQGASSRSLVPVGTAIPASWPGSRGARACWGRGRGRA